MPAVQHRSPFIVLRSSFLLVAIGCLGVTSQLVLLRELMAAYGGNEFSAGVTLTAWLLCEALGAWLAGRVRPSSIVHRPSSLSVLSILSSLAAVPAAVLIRPALGVLPGEALSIPLLMLATFAVVLLPAATHGALFVTAAANRPQGIGSAYVWEGIGTVLAGVACFLVLNRLQSLTVVALSTLPLIVARYGQGKREEGAAAKRTKWALGLAAIASLALVVLGLRFEKLVWSAAWRGQRVVSVANSPYGKIVRLERAGQQLILYDGLPVLTVPPTQTERTEELSLLPVLCHPAPRRVLVLGSDLLIPTSLARFRPDIKVVAVQLDPVLARTSLAALASDSSFLTRHSSLITSHPDSSLLPPPFSLVVADPITFLRTTGDIFDCIILTDAVPVSLGSSRLFSQEFYRLCRSCLAPGGMMATATPGNPSALSPDLVRVVSTRRQTLAAVFDHVLPLAVDFPLFLASNREIGAEPESILSRLSRLPQPPRLLDSSYVASLLDPFRQTTLASQIANRHSPLAAAAPVGQCAIRHSSLAGPRELFLNMVRENRLVSPAFGAFYARLGGLSARLLLMLGVLLLLVGVAGAWIRGPRFSRGFAVLTSGFSGAAASTLLLFAWQVRYGSVFSGVALLVAAFMLGTVLGGHLGSRSTLVPRPSSIVYRFLAADLVLSACAVAAIPLTRGGPASLFLLVNCLAGACLGCQFALAGSAAAKRQSPFAIRQSAGILTALDLVGGSLGGILTALILVPVFGIAVAALSAGAVKLASALAQLAAAGDGSCS